ncbi:beta-galactosidase GalA [Paenibacillus sp.]|uniref:beta-galactosidase GalA n=1 Tax=Paenibacillus sp. TaxID=58172 RepID=UPI002D4BEA44|nr:beta-galactosidase GalA [Paenibacillus sp.]HZG58781.1 beta-galactosidase GalA [Paenibacillus sp.]
MKSVMTGKAAARETMRFDEGWYFHRGDIPIPYAVKAGRTGGFTDCEKPEHGQWLEIAYSDEFSEGVMDPKKWELVDLPHDWAIEQSYVKHYPKGRAHLAIGIGCYRKLFSIPAEDEGKRFSLRFDGVMRNSTVWVNGHLIGTQASGYTSFTYDITDVLRYGDEGRNVVFVRVDASEYEGWWYDGCGIYRHVWLTKTDPLRVKEWGTFVTTPEVDAARAKVRVETEIVNGLREAADFRLVTELLDAEGKSVARVESDERLEGDAEGAFAHEAIVAEPRLWHPDRPNLYRAVTSILRNGETADTYETTFGIRTIEFTKNDGFFMNGEPLVIQGVCVHQDFAGVGAALPDRIQEYKIELLKEMGANAYRCAHHPPTPELLDACDRLGMLVMDENRKLDSSPAGLANLESLIRRDRNHPSVIMWSMENEEVLEGTKTGARILDTLARRTRKLDPTRPVVASMNHGYHTGGYADAVDIVGYNYGTYDNDRDIRDKATYPDRIVIGSESASYTVTRGIYADDERKAYCSEYGTKLAPWCVSPERVLRSLAEHRFLTGTFVWTGFDYKGEPTPYNWPAIGSHFGIMDSCGFPKHNYYYYKANWTEEPVVHLFPHWSWHGRTGETIDVWVYSNCETVELLLNGRSLGAQPVDKLGHLEWKVPYEPGAIEARGYRGGAVATTHVVETTGAPSGIALAADRTTIAADGRDVSMIRVSIVDERGRVVPTADNEVRFTVEGAGKLIGVGNGDPSSHESDKAPYRRAFNGYALAIVQAGKEAGELVVKAEAIGLRAAELRLETR